MRLFVWGAALLVIGAVATACYDAHAADAKDGNAKSDVAADREWDAAFTRTSGWVGGDVAGSLQLPDGRTLWLFGDTWIGEVKDGQRVGGAKMVNNTIAVTPAMSDPAKPPRADDVKFFWNASGKAPAAWVTPPKPAGAGAKDFADKVEDTTWYWPTGGAVAWPAADAPQKSRVGVFLFEVGHKAAGGGGVWNFENRGGAVAIIDNPSDAVEKWRVTTHALPYQVKMRPDDAKEAARKSHSNSPAVISWGMAAIAEPAKSGGDALIYFYGRREHSAKDGMVVARVAGSKLAQLDAWEYFAGEQNGTAKRNGAAKWSRDAADAAAIATGVTSEFSVEPIEVAGKRRYVMIQSEPLLGRRIFSRWADAPTGPWSDAKPFYTVRDVERHKSFFTYAAKGHVALSRPGELLVTYLVNAHDFGAGFRDAEIYRPRFLRVPVAGILERK